MSATAPPVETQGPPTPAPGPSLPVPRPARRSALAAVAALVLPGLGHALVGERRKGVAFFAIVATTFGTGLLLGGRLAVADVSRPWTLVAAAAARGAGLLDAGARLLGLGLGPDRGTPPSAPAREYGDAYLQSAAAMNLLLVVDLVARPRPRGNG